MFMGMGMGGQRREKSDNQVFPSAASILADSFFYASFGFEEFDFKILTIEGVGGFL